MRVYNRLTIMLRISYAIVQKACEVPVEVCSSSTGMSRKVPSGGARGVGVEKDGTRSTDSSDMKVSMATAKGNDRKEDQWGNDDGFWGST